jgi:DNA-binding CsgD family transcriptional regulator
MKGKNNSMDTINPSDIKNLLTKTEYKILLLIADGKPSKAIAEALGISPFTVKNHRYNMIKKMNLKPENNTLSKWAVQNKAEF